MLGGRAILWYPPGMSIRAVGRVVGGHLRVDIPTELPENTEVELVEADVADADDDDPALREALEESVAQMERGQVVAAEDVLDELCPSGTDECRATG